MASSRRLLLISFHALPRVTPGSLRVNWIASRLAACGWDVTLLTSVHDPTPIDGVRIVTTSSGNTADIAGRPSRLRTLWNDHAIPDRHVLWLPALVRRAARLMREAPCDVVLSTSPPHSTHLGVLWLKRTRRFHWVADFRDPWSTPWRIPRDRISAAIQRRMESAVLSRCDGVLANTEGNRTALIETFPSLPEARVHVLPNAYDDPMFEATIPGEMDAADITYVGEVYPGMVDRLAAAISNLLRREPERVPRIAIYGEVDPRERRKMVAAGVDGVVEMRGRVSYEESLRVIRSARSLLLLLPDGANWSSCVPSKLYPYMASGRPVLAIVPDGDAATLVTRTGTGIAVVGGQEETAAAVSEFVACVRRGGPWPERHDELVGQYAASALSAQMDGILTRAMESPQ